jgi:outer membrane protein TolC
MGPRWRWLGWVVVAAASGCGIIDRARDPYASAPPTPERPWTPPAAIPAPASVPGLLVAPEPDRVYDLPALIDLAQRANPETRRSWEQARASAARLGLAESAWLPVLAVRAAGGTARIEDRTATGPVYTFGPSITSLFALQWTLIDFGRRSADTDRAAEELLASNLQFNRTHQDVTFMVQRTFYAYDASRARVDAEEATLKAAIAVEEAASARMEQGLETQTQLLLARQERARAQYDLQASRRGVADAGSALAEALGISPSTLPRTVALAELPLPSGLAVSVEEAMDTALASRPDLAARLATLRAREAEVRRARAEFWPRVGLTGGGGGTAGRFKPQHVDRRFGYDEVLYSGFLEFSWVLFDGFARENAVRSAEAKRGEAEADVTALQLETLRTVWKSYADVQVAMLQVDFADALLAASQDAYDAAFTSYTAGLADILDLLAAERDLARARMTRIDSRADLLNSAAALAFAVGNSGETLVRSSVR